MTVPVSQWPATKTYAWAIFTGERDTGHNNGFVGRYWFTHKYGAIPSYFSGYRVAVWATRGEARKALREVKPKEGCRAFPNAKVVKVRIHIYEVKGV